MELFEMNGCSFAQYQARCLTSHLSFSGWDQGSADDPATSMIWANSTGRAFDIRVDWSSVQGHADGSLSGEAWRESYEGGAASLAASVDARGAVRGDLDSNSGNFPDQAINPYGQGQRTLALAALVRAGETLGGETKLRPALDRASAFLSGAYAPGAAGRLFVLDEHWTCLAASAIHDVSDVSDVSGATPGMPICRAYLAQSASETPTPTNPLSIAAGPAGGLAEAVVAAALIDPDPALGQRALAFGQHFLDSQYRPADSPLLPRPSALLGGFRDSPWELDVRVDAVQHIGCALLGIEALLRGQDAPGSRP